MLNTRDTIRETRFARDLGADGTMLGFPVWCAMSVPGAVQFYRDVAEARPDMAIARRRARTLVGEKIHYWMPIFEDRLRNDRRPQPELLPAVFDEDYADLDDRIARLETGLVWTEDPPSRIRHLITNVEAYEAENGEIDAYSNFLVCRNRLETEETILVGGREDRLVQRGGALKLIKRKILVPQRVVKDTNLYYFI